MRTFLFGIRQSDGDRLWRPVTAVAVDDRIQKLFVGDGEPGRVGKDTARARAMREFDRFCAEPDGFASDFPAFDLRRFRHGRAAPSEPQRGVVGIDDGIVPDAPPEDSDAPA